MKTDKNLQRKPLFPVLLTLAGVSMGLLLALLAVWADYESTSYGFFRRAQARFDGLVCPVVIGKGESSLISIKISNPTDRTISPGVQVELSTPDELTSETDFFQVAPGEQITLQKSIGPQNVDLGMFIFVNALVFSTHPIPARESTCGVLVLPIARGAPLLIAGTILSIVCMAAGTLILYKNKQPAWRSRSLLFIVIATALAMFLGFSGSWLVAGVLIILSILTLLITGGGFFT